MSSAELLWFVMGAGVCAYVLTAGADFGGGIWHLFARGPRAHEQRHAVERAIAPIWEANHVWLIFVIVAMFTAFPRAFAVVSVALHVPITLALLGIVFRGSSFVFYSYDLRQVDRTRGWARVFGVSSLLTPVFLGDSLGALSTGAIRWDGKNVTSDYFAGWLTPFAVGTGVFAVFLFALLAAVYLTVDSDVAVQGDFRARALALEVATGMVAAVVFWLSRWDAPALYASLASSSYAVAVQVATALAASAVVVALVVRRYRLARAAVVVQVALVVVGWGLAMRGAIVLPDVRLGNAGARSEVVAAVIPALLAGTALLLPALLYLFRVFKKPV
ncbi:MAG TPA: cytochrome d ubiquinol oxidase subunit II [Polyangiaceae bacterium]|nr:cytochrome d ubiquinol oxidase subunit II [Polyangiaceae bacterium]